MKEKIQLRHWNHYLIHCMPYFAPKSPELLTPFFQWFSYDFLRLIRMFCCWILFFLKNNYCCCAWLPSIASCWANITSFTKNVHLASIKRWPPRAGCCCCCCCDPVSSTWCQRNNTFPLFMILSKTAIFWNLLFGWHQSTSYGVVVLCLFS